MKKIIIGLLSCLFLTILFSSCRKDPETEPRELITGDLIWDKQDKNAVFARQFLNNVYSFIPNGFNRIAGDFLEAGTDDAIPSRNNSGAGGFAPVDFYTNGLISSITNPDPYWSNSYAGIRQANIFLTNIDSVPTAAATIKNWKAEARFIRAYMYFELLKRYGGVPLIANKVFTLNDNLQVPRNTFMETADYIIAECDAIKNDLPVEPVADADWGRIPKGAAIALKCRLYLYAASPLFNGGAPDSDQKAKGLLGYTTADPARWQKVIDAAEELRALNYYALQASFSGLFITKKNTEVIFAKQSVNNFDLENNNAPVGFVVTNVRAGGRTSPTQGFVDAFTMLNGLAITDALSGYDAGNPYANRDKRLDATVFYNGVRWLQRPVETFDGGLDRPNTNVVQTKTGYYLRKFMNDFSNNTSYSAVSHNFIIFRYAEILLNYAEALNEVGRVEDAVQQIILIRKRAGITAGVAARYGIKAGISLTEMRELIRNERRVELAYEEQRFFDLRRWKIADQKLNGPLTGIKITRTGTVLTYQVVQVSNMIFSNKLYFQPIPYDEIIKNSALVQNPSW